MRTSGPCGFRQRHGRWLTILRGGGVLRCRRSVGHSSRPFSTVRGPLWLGEPNFLPLASQRDGVLGGQPSHAFTPPRQSTAFLLPLEWVLGIGFSKRILLTLGGLGMSVFSPRTEAQATGVALSCVTNYCQAAVRGLPRRSSTRGHSPGKAHPRSPFTCNSDGLLGHKSSCVFHCYTPYQDRITMHVSVADASGAYIGDASAAAICNGSASGL